MWEKNNLNLDLTGECRLYGMILRLGVCGFVLAAFIMALLGSPSVALELALCGMIVVIALGYATFRNLLNS